MERKQIQNEVDKTLEVFDQLQRVEGNPYLMTRIKARLEKEQPVSRTVLALRWVALVTLIAINSLTIFYWLQQDESSATTGYEIVASTYQLDQSVSLDDLLNP